MYSKCMLQVYCVASKGTMHTYVYQAYSYLFYCIGTITTPPEDTTVCRGSDVTISCGYDSDVPLDVLWRINVKHFNESQLMNMSSYQVNNPTTPINYSLTVFSLNATTDFRCIIGTQPLSTVSSLVTVTVIGMYVYTYVYIMYIILHILKLQCN